MLFLCNICCFYATKDNTTNPLKINALAVIIAQ